MDDAKAKEDDKDVVKVVFRETAAAAAAATLGILLGVKSVTWMSGRDVLLSVVCKPLQMLQVSWGEVTSLEFGKHTSRLLRNVIFAQPTNTKHNKAGGGASPQGPKEHTYIYGMHAKMCEETTDDPAH